jgi:hypothetical protein
MDQKVLTEANYLLGDELDESVGQMIASSVLNLVGYGFIGTMFTLLFGMSVIGLKQIREFKQKINSEDPLVRTKAKIANYYSHHPMKMSSLAHDYLGHNQKEKEELISKIEKDVGLDKEESKAFESEINRLSKMLNDINPLIDDSGLQVPQRS